MANRRMFSMDIVESDAFMDMPLSTQALYFHLAMNADDDGFVGSPKKVQRMCGATADDLNLLIARRFVLAFGTGIVVIKHWRMMNTHRKDRSKPTVHQEELAILKIKPNGAYTFDETAGKQLMATNWQPTGNQLAGSGCRRIDKNRVEESRTEEKDIMSGKPDRVPCSEVVSYLNERTGRDFKATSKATRRLVHARSEEGFTLEDFKAVIDSKADEWLGNPEFSKFLRPETLFGSKFEGYLNAARNAPEPDYLGVWS